MLLAGILLAKKTQHKVMECTKIKAKSQTHNFRVPGIMGTHNILQHFLGQALECSEISSPIIQTRKNPLQTHNFFLLGSIKKLLKFMGCNISDSGYFVISGSTALLSRCIPLIVIKKNMMNYPSKIENLLYLPLVVHHNAVQRLALHQEGQ
jgi:hypothetical protein